tara:strand:- start:793 stop:915 length:123 start_codon:yes stop_codon:yes gene_type:complete
MKKETRRKNLAMENIHLEKRKKRKARINHYPESHLTFNPP